MGQKVNPVGFRVGITEDWKSRWYAPKNAFGDFLGVCMGQQALLSVVQARANRLADTAALYQALGGGWWNRPNAEPERPATIADFFQ